MLWDDLFSEDEDEEPHAKMSIPPDEIKKDEQGWLSDEEWLSDDELPRHDLMEPKKELDTEPTSSEAAARRDQQPLKMLLSKKHYTVKPYPKKKPAPSKKNNEAEPYRLGHVAYDPYRLVSIDADDAPIHDEEALAASAAAPIPDSSDDEGAQQPPVQPEPRRSRRRRPLVVRYGESPPRSEPRKLVKRPHESEPAPKSKKWDSRKLSDRREPQYSNQVDKIYKQLNIGAKRFGIRGDRIMDDEGQIVPNSSVRRSIMHLLRERVKKTDPRAVKKTDPPGTHALEERLMRDPILYSWTRPPPKVNKRKRGKKPQKGSGIFCPRKWNSWHS